MEAVQYFLRHHEAHLHYLPIRIEFPVTDKTTFVRLSAWRPGRYELGNFAKNVRDFRVCDEKGNSLAFQKTDKQTWKVTTENTSFIIVEYSYFSNELNAGSTFMDDSQLYVNPVNCLMYTDETAHLPVHLHLDIPQEWTVAAGFPSIDKVFHLQDFDELADSPFICSPNLACKTYQVQNHTFYIWFNDLQQIPWEKVVLDFQKFTEEQLADFGHFPVKDFHFLIHGLAIPAYHGVEHLTSTVITLGPSYAVFKELYPELLGVSSHELYHVWNVKSIRPQELVPYNFKGENYSRMGYLYEGVTTYMGDLYLLKSGVFTLEQYCKELADQFQKHIDNPGRANYSVGDSSFDTWLDGYVPGAPGRKVSIYTEGCLLAFIADYLIRKGSQHRFGLENVLKELYQQFARNGKGVTEQDYKNLLEQFSQVSFDDYFSNLVHGTSSYFPLLNEALNFFGLFFTAKENPSYSESRWGIKSQVKNGNALISTIYPNSPAELAGLSIGDEIISVNAIKLNGDLDRWLNYFNQKTITITISRSGRMLDFEIHENQERFYPIASISKHENLTQEALIALKYWGRKGIENL